MTDIESFWKEIKTNYTTQEQNLQHAVTDMSKRRYRPGQVGEEAARLMEEEPILPPKGLTRLGRKIWKALDTPDPERDRKMSHAFDELFWPNRPEERGQNTKCSEYENTQ